MLKLVIFCAVITVSHCGYVSYSDAAPHQPQQGYYVREENVAPSYNGYYHGGNNGYITNSLDYYGPGRNQYDDKAKQEEYIPVIQNGVPLDTPEVQRAKQEHFSLYSQAAAAAEAAPENDGDEEEKKQQPQQQQAPLQYYRPQPKISYVSARPQPQVRPLPQQQLYTQAYYPKYVKQAPIPLAVPNPIPQRVAPHVHSVAGDVEEICIIGPDEPHELQQARADHLAAHKDVLAYLHHTRQNSGYKQRHKRSLELHDTQRLQLVINAQPFDV